MTAEEKAKLAEFVEKLTKEERALLSAYLTYLNDFDIASHNVDSARKWWGYEERKDV